MLIHFSRAKLDPSQMVCSQNLIWTFYEKFCFYFSSIASFFPPIPGVISGPRSPTGPYIFLSSVTAHKKTETQPDPSEKGKCKRSEDRTRHGCAPVAQSVDRLIATAGKPNPSLSREGEGIPLTPAAGAALPGRSTASDSREGSTVGERGVALGAMSIFRDGAS
jgi:hypothetical protein